MTDLLMDKDGDLLIGPNGDFVVNDSTVQHQRDIIESGKGFYKASPKVGVDIYNYLNDEGTADDVAGIIRVQLQDDGQDVESIDVTINGQIKVTANYPA